MKVITGTSAVVLLLTLLNVDLTVAGDWDQPVPPGEYNDIIGQGFASSLFREGNFDKVYNVKMIKAIHDAGFTNMRIRCHADHDAKVDNSMFPKFLDNLTTVVDDCLYYNITPIISWTHKRYVANTTIENAKEDYINWWDKVAKKLQNKDYRCSFNLITEIANGVCMELYNDCSNCLMNNPDTYDDWTKAVIAKIRKSGGNNKKRILILASPLRYGEGLSLIDESIYKNDTNLMVEFHEYAAGPNKNLNAQGIIGPKYWSGNGNEEMRNNVRRHIQSGADYTASTGIPAYFGAWTPIDQHVGKLNQSEVISFARYIIQVLGNANIPWTLNAIQWFHDKKTYTWIEELDNNGTKLYMNEILEQIKDAMKPYTPCAD